MRTPRKNTRRSRRPCSPRRSSTVRRHDIRANACQGRLEPLLGGAGRRDRQTVRRSGGTPASDPRELVGRPLRGRHRAPPRRRRAGAEVPVHVQGRQRCGHQRVRASGRPDLRDARSHRAAPRRGSSPESSRTRSRTSRFATARTTRRRPTSRRLASASSAACSVGRRSTAQIVHAVGGLGLNALFLKFSRAAETRRTSSARRCWRRRVRPAAHGFHVRDSPPAAEREPSKLTPSSPTTLLRRSRGTGRQERASLEPAARRRRPAASRLPSGPARLPRPNTMGEIAQAAPGSGSGADDAGQVPSQQPDSSGPRRGCGRIAARRLLPDPVSRELEGLGGGTAAPRNDPAEQRSVRTSNGQDVLVYGVLINHCPSEARSETSSRIGGSRSPASRDL